MNTYDCVIIGGGIAGLTAAIYTARAGLNTLIIEKAQVGGQIVNSLNVENYPGFKSISGYDLIENIKSQVIDLGVEIVDDEAVKLDRDKVTTSHSEYGFKTAIIASGLSRRTLGIEEYFIGSGVSFCATCDGAFFRNKDVAVVGGGNTALEDALYLSNIANKVYLIHRRSDFRGSAHTLEKVKSKSNIELVLNRNINKLFGENTLSSIELDNGDKLDVSGLFVAIGLIPESKYLDGIIECDESGFVISSDTKTNVPNIFVAGDIREKNVRQLITASSDGVLAATNCINYINS